MSKFNKNNHIIGKVYELSQENMCAMIDYIDDMRKFIDEHEFYTAKEFKCMKNMECDKQCEICFNKEVENADKCL